MRLSGKYLSSPDLPQHAQPDPSPVPTDISPENSRPASDAGEVPPIGNTSVNNEGKFSDERDDNNMPDRDNRIQIDEKYLSAPYVFADA